jgi:hypothetical protein
MKEQGLRERLVPVAVGDGSPFDHGQWDVIVEPAATETNWQPSRVTPRRRLGVLR